MIAALGKNGQFINVIPSQRIILVRMGEAPDSSLEVPTEFNNDIWRKLNDVIYNQTVVDDNFTPTQFELKQNYPNPFNPSSNISFSLPSRSFVTLKIFDILGREVADLVSAEFSAGTHVYQWNAQGFSSGVYFYRLSAIPLTRRDLNPANGQERNPGALTETKKLILLR